MISLACASIPPKAYLNILDCLRSKRIGRGKYVTLLEEKACEYFNVKYCIATANGTLADMIMIAALKEMYPQKTDVILPALTFIAQANAVLWAGMNPVFVDVNEDYQMNISQVTDRITDKSILFPVHLLGKRCRILELTNYKIPEVEDCCEAMGGEYDVGKFGTKGIAGAFSMYPSHTVTTGEGGLIITDNAEFHKIARSIHNHGKRETDFDFDYVGINAKMTNLQAAIGCELIDTIDDVNRRRKKNVLIYNKILERDFYAEAPHCYPIIYKTGKERDSALSILKEKGVEARKLMSCVPETWPYRSRFGFSGDKYENSLMFANCGLFLPVHQELTKEDIKYVCSVIPKP